MGGGQVGHSLLPSEGLPTRVHDRARLCRAAQARVREARGQGRRAQRGSGHLAQGVGGRHQGDAGTRRQLPHHRGPGQEGGRPLRHDAPVARRGVHGAHGVRHRPQEEDPPDDHVPADDGAELRRDPAGDRLAPAHRHAPGGHAGELEAGGGRDHRARGDGRGGEGEVPPGLEGPHALSSPDGAAQVTEYYPVALDLRGHACLVVGGGSVGEGKVEGLLAAGARVTMVSPTLTPRLHSWAVAGRVAYQEREYRERDLDGQRLVFVATSRRKVTELVASDARRRGIWVNAADDPVYCDFLLPSVLRRGRLVVAVSTGGASPALAGRGRRDPEGRLAPEYAELVELAAEVRAELRAESRRPGGEVWRDALDGGLIMLLAGGQRDGAKALLPGRLRATAGRRGGGPW